MTRGSRDLSARGAGLVRGWLDDRRREQQRREVIAKHTRKSAAGAAAPAASALSERDEEAAVKAARARAAAMIQREEIAAAPAPRPTPPVVKRKPSTTPTLPLAEPEPIKAPTPRKMGGYTLPPASLLDPPKGEHKIDERELMDMARNLEEKCREFAVEGQVVQIHPGPVVTTFEFKPDAGVKYAKITSLADDLGLAMQAESVLIDRIPGKSTVGIQIPNPNREAISLRELLEGDVFQRSVSKLTLALGKTIHGEPFVTDLATMPHLLIAGSTGTGKSVGLDAR
jgi:S-DNA-T family DNA segregation ATPase FtsK/SpoIIIE